MANWAGDPRARQGAAFRRSPKKPKDDSFGFEDFLTKILLPAGGAILGGVAGGPVGAAGGLGAAAALGGGIEEMGKGDPASVVGGLTTIGTAGPAMYSAATPSPSTDVAQLASLLGMSPEQLQAAMQKRQGV